MGDRPLVVATGPWDQPGWADPLRAAGCSVAFGPSIDERPAQAIAPDELKILCANADAILVSTRESITQAVLDVAPNLRLVVKATIGVEKIDIPAATARSVLVVNSPAPENFIGVAEATIGLIVAMAKRLLEKEQLTRAGGWRDAGTDGTVLAGSTVGIVGLGRVGSMVARRLAGWDVELVGFDPYVSAAKFAELGVRSLPFDQLVGECNVLTLHVPLTDETHGMLGRAQLERMKRTAFLVNTSRGPVVDEDALVDALLAGALAGAALDVFTDEPLGPNSLVHTVPRDRLILTPHSIGSSRASRWVGTKMAVAAILRALDGHVPEHVLNPAAVPGWIARWTGSG